jgi:hypothetical protein
MEGGFIRELNVEELRAVRGNLAEQKNNHILG